MNINKSKVLNNLQFYPEHQDKKAIFLHHTAGTTAQGAIDWWNQTPEHVGTAYVIDRNGTVYETFPPSKWAYHLGIHGPATNTEKHSIGIEIVAAGGLIKEPDGNFYFYPVYPNKNIKRKIDSSEVWELPENWKGFKYYHSYTETQIKSTLELIKKLIKDFNIQIQPNLNNFWEFNEEVWKKDIPGIWSHSTVRIDKADIVPYKSFTDEVINFLMLLKSSNPIEIVLPKKENLFKPKVKSQKSK